MATVPAKGPFSTDNLLAGSVGIYTAPVGTPIPTIPSVGSMVVVPAPWSAKGYTDKGVKVTYQPTYKDIAADESMSTLLKLKTAEMMKASMVLKEATIENMLVAISGSTMSEVQAGAGQADIVTLDVGGSQQYTEFSLLLVGKSPYGFPRLIQIYRCIPTANVEQSFVKDDVVMIPTDFEAMTYSANPVGKQLFQIVEKRANATS